MSMLICDISLCKKYAKSACKCCECFLQKHLEKDAKKIYNNNVRVYVPDFYINIFKKHKKINIKGFRK